MENKVSQFREYVDACNEDKLIIGQGNPNSNILFVGCEPNNSNELKKCNQIHTNECLNNLNGKSFEDLWQFHKKKSEGWTWNKYQKIIDAVYTQRKHVNGILDFEEMAFCTELNNECARHSKDADKSTIGNKLELFRTSTFIQSFPVVILACGSKYIKNQGNNRQIDETFGVKFAEAGGNDLKQNFWIHYRTDPATPKLVIHTRQLSGFVRNDLLSSIGNVIRQFLNSKNLIK
jgi:hypothetical protein